MHRVALLALVACQSQDFVVGDLQEIATIKAIPNRDLDILFVVDNSGSMADKQLQLAANFPRMMDKLSELETGLPNLHIGVVTSDLGASGSNGLVGAPLVGCMNRGEDGALRKGSLTRTFLSDVDDDDGGRVANYPGTLRDAFAEIALVGVTGCSFEQHLGAMSRALVNPANAGFLRPEANLAVVIIADEDDCSVTDGATFFGPDSAALGKQTSFRCTRFGVRCDQAMSDLGDKTNCVPDEASTLVDPVQPFIDDLIATKGDERMIMVAGIVGEPSPVAVELRESPPDPGDPALAHVCSYSPPGSGELVADPAVRLAAFLDGFPGRSTLHSVCSSDLSTPLEAIGASAKKLQGDPCIDTSTLADISPAPGVQPACEVLDIRDSGDRRELPTCAGDGGDGDCYELVADPVVCPGSADHLRIKFHRAAVADDLWTSVRCQLTR